MVVKKNKGGRPLGGKHHAALRKYWRDQQRRYRAKKRAKKTEK